MENKAKILISAGIAATLIFITFSLAVKDTSIIWYQTRIFGLISYLFLFITVVLGELRMITKVKADFWLFRFHVPSAIAATYLVVLHGISAMADNFMWGKNISFLQYLGFSYGDMWLTYLSFGTLGFYLMLIVGLTSTKKNIQRIGFKRWKVIHYLSYLSFGIAHLHAANLGTDIKHGAVSAFISPLFALSLFIVISLLITRILHGKGMFSDQLEINLAASAIIVLIVGSVMLGSAMEKRSQRIDLLSARAEKENDILEAQQDYIMNLSREISDLRIRLELMKNG